VQFSSRVSACRREMNSHEAAPPQEPARSRLWPVVDAPCRHGSSNTEHRRQSSPFWCGAHLLNGARNQDKAVATERDAATLRHRLEETADLPVPARTCDWHVGPAREGGGPKSLQAPSRTPLPNPSLKPTRYGMRCKPGPRPLRHHRSPGLHRMPPRAA
jgi:hypothetical protein